MAKNKNILQKILTGLSSSDSNSDVKEVLKTSERYLLKTEKEMQEIASKLKENAEMRTVEMAKRRIAELKDQVQSVVDSLITLRDELKQGENDLTGALNERLDALKSAMAEYRGAGLKELGALSEQMDNLKRDIRTISQSKVEIPKFESQIQKVESQLSKTTSKSDLEITKKPVSDLDIEIKKLRADTMTAISAKGGGNMNRNILVGNNPSTLGRYTDLNILAGTNVTLSYVNNDNRKTTDLTIAATGGGGSNRNISTVAISSVVASVAATDYVIIANQGVQLTLPTAVGNSNLYTIKNTAASSVLVAAAGAETIDGDPNIILAVRYTAVDLISDGANWHIT